MEINIWLVWSLILNFLLIIRVLQLAGCLENSGIKIPSDKWRQT